MSEETIKQMPDIANWQKFYIEVQRMADQGVNSLPVAVFVYAQTHNLDCRLKFRFVWRGRTAIVESGSLSLIKGRARPHEFDFIDYLRERGYRETKLWERQTEDKYNSEQLILFCLPEAIMQGYPGD